MTVSASTVALLLAVEGGGAAESTRSPLIPASYELIWGGVSFLVRGITYRVSQGVDVEVPLDGQGPVRPGAPSMRASSRYRREDGSLMVPSVPTITDAMAIITYPGSDKGRHDSAGAGD